MLDVRHHAVAETGFQDVFPRDDEAEVLSDLIGWRDGLARFRHFLILRPDDEDDSLMFYRGDWNDFTGD